VTSGTGRASCACVAALHSPETGIIDSTGILEVVLFLEESFAIIEALRRNGYGVHLGTNQEQHRGGHMRTVFGYDDVFDTSCYSYDLGFAKPDPAFFAEAARRIGAEPSTILFIDDTVANVEGARVAGLEAVHWDVESGHTALIEALATYGVDARTTTS
jgi:putative hydrolase of the HAD superfamily